MQKLNIAASEANTRADLIAYFRADAKHDIADNLLIESGSLELRSDQVITTQMSPLRLRNGKRAGFHSPAYDRAEDLSREVHTRTLRHSYPSSLCSGIRRLGTTG